MDLEKVWASLQSVTAPKSMMPPRYIREFGDLLLRSAAIVTRKDEDGILFELHPRPEFAGPRNWCWILPVRSGGMPCPIDVADRFGHPPDLQLQRLWQMAYGDLVDLVAVSPDCRRVIGRYSGLAVVIGSDQGAYGVDEDRVRLFRTVDSWLRGRMQGVVMVGTNDEACEWLRRWPGGVICDDLAHGKAIDRLMKKPFAGPPVLVAA